MMTANQWISEQNTVQTEAEKARQLHSRPVTVRRESSVTPLLETLRTLARERRNSLRFDAPELIPSLEEMAREDGETVYTRAMMHAEDIRRAEIVQEMWVEFAPFTISAREKRAA